MGSEAMKNISFEKFSENFNQECEKKKIEGKKLERKFCPNMIIFMNSFSD